MLLLRAQNILLKRLAKMRTVYCRQQAVDPQNIEINFHYKDAASNVDRNFNFIRNSNETIDLCLDRIKKNVEKEFLKKSRKKKDKKSIGVSKAVVEDNLIKDVVAPVSEMPIQMFRNGQLQTDVTLKDLFSKSPSDLSLQILNQTFSVTYNLPWVDLILLPTSILAGYYVYPSKLEMQWSNVKDSQFEWYTAGLEKAGGDGANIAWTKVSDHQIYLVSNEDVGNKLKVVCTPKNGELIGPSYESISKNIIEAGPGYCPFEQRHLLTTEKLSDNKFRIVTYNLLADLYCDSDYSRTTLFPYCPPYALHIDYRKQLFTKELLGYNGDIMCLQEVDSKIFDLDLLPVFSKKDYAGTFQMKGQTAEGLAMFWNKNRFSLVEKYGINIGENINTLPAFDDLWSKIRNNDKLVERILVRSTALQVTVLVKNLTLEQRKKYLIIANTHLYFHPDADHIRLLQMGFSMLYVQHIYEKTKLELNICDEDLSIVFCGDFNSVPECGIYKLMTEKYVPDDFIDFKSNEAEAVTGVQLHQPFNFKSAYTDTKYTNFTVLFAACIDHIFLQSDKLQVLQTVPTPSDDELHAHTAIPSIVSPSDHIALISDLEWIN